MKYVHIFVGVLSSGLILSGCVATTTAAKKEIAPLQYVAPTSGPLSKVRFATTTDNPTNVYQYNDRKCSGEHLMFGMANSDDYISSKVNLNIPLNQYKNSGAKEVYVEAGKEKVFRIASVAFAKRNGIMLKLNCQQVLAYTFEEGQEYELRLDMIDMKTFRYSRSFHNKCNVELYGVDRTSAQPKLKLLKSFKQEDLNTPECNRIAYMP